LVSHFRGMFKTCYLRLINCEFIFWELHGTFLNWKICWCEEVYSLLGGKFSHLFDLQNMILTQRKDIFEKKCPFFV
jgi:hypothetical protein